MVLFQRSTVDMPKLRCCLPWAMSGLPPQQNYPSDDDMVAQNPEKQSWESDIAGMADIVADEGSNVQHELWKACFQEKLSHAKHNEKPFYQRLMTRVSTASYRSSLQALEQRYNANGLTHHLPKVRAVLNAVKPFSAAITTLVQSNQIAGLVWGSVQVMLEAVTGVIYIFECISEMTRELSNCLPRFDAYTDILHTPRLHRALRNVYSVYIDFYISTAKVLEAKGYSTGVRASFSANSSNFRSIQAEMQRAATEFDKEANLANVQVGTARHYELMSRLDRSASIAIPGSVTCGLQDRNPIFTGREDVVAQLEQSLLPTSLARYGYTNTIPRRSCVLHAAGGMGKTQIALEFTHRYTARFTHIFWVRAETETVLAESFLAILDKVKIKAERASIEKRIEMTRDYLQRSSDRWLLVYDNVQTANSIRHTWPAGQFGTILVTTQMPDFGDITTAEVLVPPMSCAEGSELIRRHLRRGGSEEESAQRLAHQLGGMPLAIAHFAGYVSRSQCSLDHILDCLRHRLQSSQIWSQTDLASVSGYNHTLETVWDLAFHRLTADARQIIDIMAFLEPDNVPEEMFIGPESVYKSSDWEYWEIHRFNLAVGVLRERNLVERFSSSRGGYLRTHRALQRSILHHLDRDPDHRERVFQQALLIIRQAFPRQNLALRAGTSSWPTSQKYILQIVSLNTAFEQSQPPMSNDMVFAELLRDGSSFLFNWHVREEALVLSRTAERICKADENISSLATLKLLPFIESDLGMYDQYAGVDARESGIIRTRSALNLYTEHNKRVGSQNLVRDDYVAVGRFHADHACCWLVKDDVVRAGEHFSQSLSAYRMAGDEQSLTVRFGMLYVFRAVIHTSEKKYEEAQELADKGLSLVNKTLGPEHHLTLWVQLLVGMCAFSRGQVESALQIHQSVLEGRTQIHAEGHHEILSSRYLVAVAHHRNGDLETAEELLRGIISFEHPSLQWRQEDIARANFRLSVVLGEQSKPREAAQFSEKALLIRKEWEVLLIEPSTDKEATVEASISDANQMALFDLGVSLWHGRTSGKWAHSGTVW